VLGYAMLQDLKEIVYLGLHYEEARAILRLAVATNAVALYGKDEEVVAEQAKLDTDEHGQETRTGGEIPRRTSE